MWSNFLSQYDMRIINTLGVRSCRGSFHIIHARVTNACWRPRAKGARRRPIPDGTEGNVLRTVVGRQRGRGFLVGCREVAEAGYPKQQLGAMAASPC